MPAPDARTEEAGTAAEGKGKPTPPGHLVVQVYNEDAGGPPLRVSSGPGEKLSKVVDAVYRALGVTQKSEDRLTCLATGEDVRQYSELHLREYAAGQCSDLVWTFARDTGGARA